LWAATCPNAAVPFYPTPGTAWTQRYSFTAASSGHVIAYYAGSKFAPFLTSVLGMQVNGVSTGITGLSNQGSSVGQSLDLGYANAGATLTFFINSSYPGTFYSTPQLNADGGNVIYSTGFSGNSTLPPGVFIGFGDVPSDTPYLNYSATTFILTNVTSQ
jgi:hypothetical protein